MLGCRLAADDRPSERLRRRVARAVELYRAGAAPALVLSGGGTGPVSEAESMRDLALAAGVPEGALLCESDSRNTVENAVNTARLLGQRGLGRVILVSDGTHLPRAALLFRLAGIEVVGRAGVPAHSPHRTFLAACYEFGALPRSLLRLLAAKRRRI